MPCVRPTTAAIASTFGLTPGARASGGYSTRSLTRSMSRSASGFRSWFDKLTTNGIHTLPFVLSLSKDLIRDSLSSPGQIIFGRYPQPVRG
jgi:hypothetical protein